MKQLLTTFFLRSAFILLLSLTITQIHAAVINVSPGASAIQNAVNGAAAGDTLLVANGTYNESVNLASAAGNITILAANAGQAIVNGGNASAFFAASHADDVTISGFTLRSTSTDGNIGVIHFTDHSGRLSISNCDLSLGGGVQIFTTGIKVENNAANVPTQVSILDNTFGPFDNDELIQIETENAASGGDVDIVIDGNSNSGVMEDGAIEIDIDRNALVAIVVVRDNNFGNWTGTGDGADLRMDGENLEAHLLVEDNVFTGTDGNGITLDCAAINSEIYAEIEGNTVAGNANTDTGILIDDESSAHSTDITAFVSNNVVSNTLQSSIRIRPFNDIPNTVNRFQVVIDGNNISNPNTDMTPVLEEAGVDISDDSGINDERYEVDVEVTNNTFSNINASTACILIEEPITMTHGTAVVEYLISGNTGCTAPTINGSPAAVADPVPSSAALGSIGDFVWEDINLDGVQDAGEPGVAGVVIAFTNGSLSGTTTTNSNGNYVIPSLQAGTYTLTISPTGKLPFITDQGQGGDATKDNDFDPASMQASVTLAAGTDNADIDGGLKATNCRIISFSTSKTDEGCPGANDGSISFGVPTGGVAPFMFSVDSGSTYVMGDSISGLVPGVYQTRVIDSNGCESDATPVTVAAGVDMTKPVIVCPTSQTVYLETNCEASLGSYAAASVTDNCTATPAVSQSPPALSTITANTTVVLTATDASGNVDTCNIMIVVSDTTSPQIVCPPVQTVYLGANCDAILGNFNADTATDNCTIPMIGQSPAASTTITANTSVTLTASDGSGNSASCSFMVMASDTIAPEIACPPDQTVIADTSRTAILGGYSPVTVSDNCGMPLVSQSPSDTSRISANTSVSLTATDASGNTADCSFMVMLDTTVSSINPSLASMRVQAYPNPTSGLITIQVEGADNQLINAELTDVNGRLFRREFSDSSEFVLDLQDLSTGIYFLKIQHKDGRHIWKKIVLE